MSDEVDAAENDKFSETSGEKLYQPTVRWTMPQRLDGICFVGRDVLGVAHDVYIMFLNLRTGAEHVYVANSRERGDGVDCLAGHKNNIFVFTEKVHNPRIFVVEYPKFNILVELPCKDVNRYKSVNIMENDIVLGFGGFPDYLITAWCWRTGQRLLAEPSGVVRRRTVYLASRSHMMVCACYGEGLVVWEVASCFHRHFMIRRAKEEATGWELAEPPLLSVCWTDEGLLYAIDSDANLYNVVSDGMKMITNIQWNENLSGPFTPRICPLGHNGILLYGPDGNYRWLKKTEGKKWRVAWLGETSGDDAVERLLGNCSGDGAAAYTAAGRIYRIQVPAAPDDDTPEFSIVVYKQRNIKRIKMIAPDCNHLITLNTSNELCLYEIHSGKLVACRSICGTETEMHTSPVEPLVAVLGAGADGNYGLALLRAELRPPAPAPPALLPTACACLTHQSVSRVVFSASGRELIAAAMAAGHFFVYKVTKEHKLVLVRYTEVGRGLADCLLMKVGPTLRAFALVLFSDKYLIGERIVCINAESGKDNKFAGKMQGPYSRLLALPVKDTMLAVPHLSRKYHILKLSGEKGVTVQVKVGAIIQSGHELKLFSGIVGGSALVTFGADGYVTLRPPDETEAYDYRLTASHRYECGIQAVAIDAQTKYFVHLTRNRSCSFTYLYASQPQIQYQLHHEGIDPSRISEPLNLFEPGEKNYLDLQEEKIVQEEAVQCKKQREEVVRTFGNLQRKLVSLLEENIAERPLHQLSLSEFNLHLENKKDRLWKAELEREEIRLHTEAKIKAQDKVTAWIKSYCWDTMQLPRVKIFAIFSHYQVENFPTLPTQRDIWPELQQTMALRTLEMENDADVFRPWIEAQESPAEAPETQATPIESKQSLQETSQLEEHEGAPKGQPHVLSGTSSHKYITVPPTMIPQTLAYSYLQMNWLYDLTKHNVQNVRGWFNKRFDELMKLKKREVGLVMERNSRLRFIIEELNKLSDLRGSFHHLMIAIKDPEWAQEEEPIKLIKVEPEECSISPYISPSQIVIPPPDPGPKDDFRERALVEMMDGVLEKLWHEEIKKPIPKPLCMLDKEPEHWNEDDLRAVFDYENKVAFRNEERDKYRKMLHAEYAKLSQVLNEGIVKFNMKVKDMWLTKLKVDSAIGQECLKIMRLRRQNLDRLESAEHTEAMRAQTKQYEREAEELQAELTQIQAQSGECQVAYDQLAAKDRQMERTFKNHFTDLSSVVVDQCYKFFKKRPKWHQRASMLPVILYDLASSISTGVRSPFLHPDCVDYFKGVEQLDQLSNMPTVMDEGLWTIMCRLRRVKIENEIRMRAVILETATVDAAVTTWARAVSVRRAFLAQSPARLLAHRQRQHIKDINPEIQIVLPAGQVEITTSGHIEDFQDAALILFEDVETINNLILKVGAIKLRMMRRQMEFRKGILAKEWEHAQMKMKLRHMQQELYSYTRLKIPKVLQWYLKNKELGYTDEQDYLKLEKEMAANKRTIERVLEESAARCEELQVKISALNTQSCKMAKVINGLNLKVSEKKLNEDPLEPIRIRRIFKERMETLVARSRLVREVQANHSRIVLLQTELELLRLKTFPTLATFRTFC